MWRTSFLATTVALGGTIEEALDAMAPSALPYAPTAPTQLEASPADATLASLIEGLRAPSRPARANALAGAVREIVVAIHAGAWR